MDHEAHAPRKKPNFFRLDGVSRARRGIAIGGQYLRKYSALVADSVNLALQISARSPEQLYLTSKRTGDHNQSERTGAGNRDHSEFPGSCR
jgi:hypothetical protein